jgi:thiol-disulfide isomerase/thioredoxin
MRITHTIGIALLVSLAGVASGARKAAGQESAAAGSKRPSIYDEKADARELLEAGLKSARRDRTNVLVMLGGNWCGWCHKLHDVFERQKEIRALVRDEYELLMVDTQAPGAAELMKEWGVETDKGVPHLVVLDAEGKLVTRQETGSLEEGDHHDPAKVKEFLAKNVAPRAEASSVVKDGIARAESEDKRVLLHFGAPWCGWCHKLDDFLARPEIAEIVEKDYVEVKVDTDRMAGGAEVLNEYREGKDGGIPWMVILDANGRTLATSDGEKGNVGYPVEPHEIDHFLSMVCSTARRISGGEIDRLERSLEEAAREIRGAIQRRGASR